MADRHAWVLIAHFFIENYLRFFKDFGIHFSNVLVTIFDDILVVSMLTWSLRQRMSLEQAHRQVL